MISRRKFIVNNINFGISGLLLNSRPTFFTNIHSEKFNKKIKLKPTLIGDWWLIGPPPRDFDNKSLLNTEELGSTSGFESVDHHIFRGHDDYWHLWGCVRGTGLGRILYHWKAKRLTDSPWEYTGEFIRSEISFGESIDDWNGQEWIQSPFFIKEKGKYYMYYGGHSTGRTNQGVPVTGSKGFAFDSECQICLMTSLDGLTWERHLYKDGLSRLFVGQGEARDPCIIKVNELWYMYYTGYEDRDPYNKGAVFLRTSRDLINWSDYSLVHRDPPSGVKTWDYECPFVTYREGYFYLFRTMDYNSAITHVYRSEDPQDFGKNSEIVKKKYVGTFPVAAPEIYEFDGKEYVSSNHNTKKGTQMSQMKWELA